MSVNRTTSALQAAASSSAGFPALGAGIGLRAQHYQDVLAQRPAIGWLEVHSENYFGSGGRDLHVLQRLRADYPISLHGVGLGLGSAHMAPAMLTQHLQQLRALVQRIDPALVSEHLCWGAAGTMHLNDLLPLPFSHDALTLLCQRVDQVQQVLGRRILLENVSTYLRYPATSPDALSETAFLTELAARTGCGILLDINNLYVNQCNHGEDALAALHAIPPSYVGELHLAGHLVTDDAVIDHHGTRVAPPVWQLYEAALQRFGPVSTLVEWDTDLPALSVLLEEADHASQRLAHVISRRNPISSLADPTSGTTPHPMAETMTIPAAATSSGFASRLISRCVSSPAPQLAAWQASFASSLLQPSAPTLPAPWLPPDATDGPPLSPARFALYRGNLHANWEKALAAAYPVIQQLVGEAFFQGLSRHYGRAHPSTSGDLNRFGAQFAAFLAAFPHAADYPYLPDLARLEWCLHHAFSAADRMPLGIAVLAGLSPAQLEAQRFALAPAAHLLHTGWNAVALWQAHQPDAPPDALNQLTPTRLAQPCHTLVWRASGQTGWQPCIQALTPAAFAALQQLQAGADLGSALETALQLEPTFDIAGHLHTWLEQAVLTDPGPPMPTPADMAASLPTVAD